MRWGGEWKVAIVDAEEDVAADGSGCSITVRAVEGSKGRRARNIQESSRKWFVFLLAKTRVGGGEMRQDSPNYIFVFRSRDCWLN